MTCNESPTYLDEYRSVIGKTFTCRQETHCQDLHNLTFKNTQSHKIWNVYTFQMICTNCAYPYFKVTRPVFCLSVFLFHVLLEIRTQIIFSLLLKIAKCSYKWCLHVILIRKFYKWHKTFVMTWLLFILLFFASTYRSFATRVSQLKICDFFRRGF